MFVRGMCAVFSGRVMCVGLSAYGMVVCVWMTWCVVHIHICVVYVCGVWCIYACCVVWMCVCMLSSNLIKRWVYYNHIMTTLLKLPSQAPAYE